MTDKQVHSGEARLALRELLDDVGHRGEHVTITRWGHPVAVLVPVHWYEAACKESGTQEVRR